MRTRLLPSPSGARNANLDLLRAAAIALVVVKHLAQMSPAPHPRLTAVTEYGQYGVDLFFALSGWLIGTLYWREHARFGAVSLRRFWTRRWLRTLPPYYAALGLAWLAVALDRGEPFHWSYVVFAQNYAVPLPFFLVSWSICIEEHFYLFLPCVLAVAAARPRASRVVPLFLALTLVSPVSRWLLSLHGWGGVEFAEFGLAYTATHMRLEGLMLGFLAAYLPYFEPRAWQWLTRRWLMVRILSLAALAGFVVLPGIWGYRFGYTLLDAGCVGLLISFVDRVPGRLAVSRATAWVALTSYSVYLTHSLGLHAAIALMKLVPAVPAWTYFPLALSIVAVVGIVFWRLIEVTAMEFRERVAHRRDAALPTPQAVGG